ncbi:ATP-binding protein [Bacillus bingmayongensis]|uniref:ATP-binding protein n=1 Tax=Bacillus bingmayongensis TaxID=1150157 RepID=UPI001C8DB4FB|nr:ATP-binding protein [Bacillus bingmayongensis]MBY0600369.1 ATP-binding protein [Bacillus bingmayongensis]
MLRSMKRNPLKHIEGNLAISTDGKVSGVYEVDGFEYDHQDESTKKMYYRNQLALFTHQEYDVHLLVIPRTTNSDEILDEHIANLKGPMAPAGRYLFTKMKEYLRNASIAKENMEYRFYILVQLNPQQKERQIRNPVVETWKFMKKLKEGFSETAHNVSGMNVTDILEEEIEKYLDVEEVLYNQVRGAFRNTRRATPASIRFLFQHNFTRGMKEPNVEKNWKTGSTLTLKNEEGKPVKVRRPNLQEMIHLTDCVIDESLGRSLTLERQNEEGEIENMHVAFLAVKSMPEISSFPGGEWIYRLQSQSLKFPVEMSVRAYHLENQLVTQKLTNSELELNDQRRQAMVGGRTTDLTIERKAKGVKIVKDRFETTGAPGYELSVLFCVYAEDEKTLKSRVNTLITEYRKMKIELVNPYGEQLAYFYEFLPGSTRYNTDFKLFVEPGVLAQGMFGATTQIGDNQGFYIGKTTKLNRPVFIRPDLAAKALGHIVTEFDSLSVMFAGQTGKGKSFLMNLLVFWIVMSGGRAFVIDPKGDRTRWPELLPGFNEETLQVWTLGKSKEDAGCLDPFRISATKEDAKSLALEILTFLSNVGLEDTRYDYLYSAIEKVAEKKEACMTLVRLELEEMKLQPNILASELEKLNALTNRLATLEGIQLGDLLFGRPGQNYRVLSLERPLQVLQIQHLRIPKTEEKNESVTDKLSRSILIALAAFGKSLMHSDRSIFKVYVQDEASSILKNKEGAASSDKIIREGRYHNTGLYLGSQNASDYQSENKEIANVGMKFCFALKYDDEAKEMLRYYNLPVTEENITRLRGLHRGQALFQDIFGRTAVVDIDPVFQELLTAFDSSTKTDEERAQQLA